MVIAFGVLSIWGTNLFMMSDAVNMMPDCPFAAEMSQACPMSVSSHISHWQQLFLSVPAKNGTLMILGTLLLMGAFFIAKYLVGSFNIALIAHSGGGMKSGSAPNSFNCLFRAIGSGIVHKRE